MANLVGTQIDRYHILEQLGEGGMATVYKAYDTRLEREVAIKVIRRDAFPPNQLERILKRFEREAKALAKLSHLHIIKVNDYGEYDGSPYLVMEYLPGGTLKQKLTKPIPWQEAIKIIIPIAEALGYAHEHSVIHRDIKPANILLTEKGQPMLSDFGIAKILEVEETATLTGTGIGVGTPEYMAPEQWSGQTTTQSDIYSLGVVFYEMLAGRKPYSADTPAAILLKQANELLPRPKIFVPDIPDVVEKILLKALAKRPVDRFQSMNEFGIALEKIYSAGAKNKNSDKFRNESNVRNGHSKGLLVKFSRNTVIGGILFILISSAVAIGINYYHRLVNSDESAGVVSLSGGLSTPVSISLPTSTAIPVLLPSTGSLKIVSSLPLTGESLTQTQPIVNAINLRLEQAGSRVCGGIYTVTYESWDDASALLGKWDPSVETENANKAAADKSIIVYLGTFNSGAAKLSIPILNAAGPLTMISPANTNPGLTKAAWDLPGVTESYYPTGVRSYARVVAADDVQGKVAANFVKSLGAATVYILDDQEFYGKGIADVFEAAAIEIGLTVVGRQSIDPKAPDYKALMTKISTSSGGAAPDAIYVGMVVDNNASQLLKDKVSIMGNNETVKFIGPDGIQTQAFIDGAGADVAEGVYASVAGIPFDELPESGKKFKTDYEAKYGLLTEAYSVYGYEAMSVALKAIEDVCAAGGDPTDRAAINTAVHSIKDFPGALGTWSFDANGDTTLTDMTFYQVSGGAFVYVGILK